MEVDIKIIAMYIEALMFLGAATAIVLIIGMVVAVDILQKILHELKE